jgi:hypothetical protein
VNAPPPSVADRARGPAAADTPKFAADWLEQYTGRRHLVFLCSEHRGQVDGAHLITDVELAELERRKERIRRQLAGEAWE